MLKFMSCYEDIGIDYTKRGHRDIEISGIIEKIIYDDVNQN